MAVAAVMAAILPSSMLTPVAVWSSALIPANWCTVTALAMAAVGRVTVIVSLPVRAVVTRDRKMTARDPVPDPGTPFVTSTSLVYVQESARPVYRGI